MYRLNFSFLEDYGVLLLEGAVDTLIIVAVSLVISFSLGVIIAAFRNSRVKILRAIGAVWVEFLRNTPFLVQLFFVFYGLPALGISTDPIITACIALGINGSAPNCEVIRSGLLACKAGYYECSAALGFTPIQTLRYTVLPISIRVAFKPLTSNFINLVLTSSVAFSITVNEIMGTAKTVAARSARPFEVYLVIMVSYCIITFALSFIAKAIDKKIAITL